MDAKDAVKERERETEKESDRKRQRSDLTLSLSLSLSLCLFLRLKQTSVGPSVRQARDDTRFLAAKFLSIVDRDAEKTHARWRHFRFDRRRRRWLWWLWWHSGGGGGAGGECLSGPN